VTDPYENMAGYRRSEVTVHLLEISIYPRAPSGNADASGTPGLIAA